ncbi:MAG: hypothetical protein E7013_04275 [Alphaproteobacteria bacterium]|nr:hypothetical protein [Alphaproteobacteria bacterium]
MAKDKIPLLEPEFEGCFSEFIEIDSKNKIYPQEASASLFKCSLPFEARVVSEWDLFIAQIR